MMTCGAPCSADFDDDHTRATVSTVGTLGSAASAAAGAAAERSHMYYNADYTKNVTPLFRAIEKENWEGIILFLTQGKWSSSLFTSSQSHMDSPSADIQAKTWVTCYDRKGNAEWSQLPLHAAISYLAPLAVVQNLVKLYPQAIQCTDNEGMLPIHLAFGFGATDALLAFLTEPFPSSMSVRGIGDRLPYECCELGPNKARGSIYKMATNQAKQHGRDQVEKEWRESIANSARCVGHTDPLDIEDKTLSEVLTMLLKDRKELGDLKWQVASNAAKKNFNRPVLSSPTSTKKAARASNSKKNRLGKR